MDFGRLLSRAWNIIWEHKFLIVLGIIIAIISGGGSGMGGGGSSNGGDTGWGEHTEYGDPDQPDFQEFDFGEDFEDLDLPFFSMLAPLMVVAGGVLAIVIFVALIVGLVFSYISRVATGSIIAGVNQVETTGESSFGEAWRAGWARGLNLFLIGLVSSLPAIVTAIVVAVLVIPLIGVNTQLDDIMALWAANTGLAVTIISLCCIGGGISLVFSAIRHFADRACVLEEKGVVESYTEGWNVLRNNLGSAMLLFVIQVGIQLVIWTMLLLPNTIASACCFLKPVVWVFSGTSLAYFSTLWTLAWREWTQGPGEPIVIEQAPAV